MDLLKSLFGPPLPALSPREAHAKLAGQPAPFLLDVRQPEEFRHERVAGAKLIPLNELPRRMNELPAGREILVICHSSARSSSATRQLITAGYNALNVRGGLIGWQFAGLPIQKK
jgi:rhodanese-related sulfurtransferase